MKFLLYILSAILTGFIFFLLFGLLHLIGIKINPDTAAKIIFVAMLVGSPLLYNYINRPKKETPPAQVQPHPLFTSATHKPSLPKKLRTTSPTPHKPNPS